MTAIVGCVDREQQCVWIGADSIASNGCSAHIVSVPKVCKIEGHPNCIIGYTTSFRMGQLLQYATGLFDELAVRKDAVDERYMVTQFVPALRKLFSDGGFGGTKNEEWHGGSFLIGVGESLYTVQSDYSVLSYATYYAAVGAGEQYALGCLHATDGCSAKERVQRALSAAEHHSALVRGPFHIMSTKNPA